MGARRWEGNQRSHWTMTQESVEGHSNDSIQERLNLTLLALKMGERATSQEMGIG